MLNTNLQTRGLIDQIRKNESLFMGETFPVYETNCEYYHKRYSEGLICKAKFICFQDPKSDVASPFEIHHGYYCKMKVISIKKNNRGLVVGEEYIFSVSKLDFIKTLQQAEETSNSIPEVEDDNSN